MSIYYPSSNCGGGAIPDYYCNPCLDSSTIEYGRIRSIALIKNTYINTVMANPTSSSVWSTGISAANIIVIYLTQGSYDGGTTGELTGFGDSATYNGNTTHTLTYKDPFSADNCDFYNAIRNSTDYTIAFRTSSKVWFAEEPCTFTPKNAVADDINSAMAWEVGVKWTNSDSPCGYETPSGIFDTCYIHS
jgi:hypothetical protein